MTMRRFAIPLAALFVACAAVEASAVTLTPSSAGIGWTRGDAGTTYMEWDVFEAATPPTFPPSPAATLAPDLEINGASAVLIPETAGTIITSTNNIYMPPGPPGAVNEFTVDFPISSNAFTRVAVQIRTQGTELDVSSLLLGGSAPTFTEELNRVTLGGFGGELVDRLAIWDLVGATGPLTLDFQSEEANLSLDRLVIDTGSQATAFEAIEGTFAVPEPNSIVLGIAGLLGVLGLMVRREANR